MSERQVAARDHASCSDGRGHGLAGLAGSRADQNRQRPHLDHGAKPGEGTEAPRGVGQVQRCNSQQRCGNVEMAEDDWPEKRDAHKPAPAAQPRAMPDRQAGQQGRDDQVTDHLDDEEHAGVAARKQMRHRQNRSGPWRILPSRVRSGETAMSKEGQPLLVDEDVADEPGLPAEVDDALVEQVHRDPGDDPCDRRDDQRGAGI